MVISPKLKLLNATRQKKGVHMLAKGKGRKICSDITRDRWLR